MAYGFHKSLKDSGRILLCAALCALLWMAIEIRKGRFLRFFGGLPAAGAVIFSLLVAAGAFRMAAELKPCPLEAELLAGAAGTASVEGKLKSVSAGAFGYSLVLSDPVIAMDGQNYRLPAIMVSAGEEADNCPELVAGMRVRVTGRPELISGARNPGEFDYAGYYRSLKLRCRMKTEQVTVIDGNFPPLAGWVKVFKSHVSEALYALCEGEDRGIYEALLLGDKSELDEDIRTLYQKNGIAHLLAVSGLHVGLIGMGLYGLLRRFGLGYQTAGFFSFSLIFFYGCLTGFGPSVFRAVLMMSASFLASCLGRTYDLLSAASLALLLLAAEEPFLLFTSGVQLSFGAVFALGIGNEQLKAWECDGRNLMWPGLFIQIFTYPVILYHFFEFPIYGIFLNLCVIPLIGYVVSTGILAVAFYTVGGFLLPSGIPAVFFQTAARAAVGPGHYILGLYDLLCHLAERLPFYSVTAGRPALASIFVYYAAVFIFMLLKRGDVKRQRRRFLLASAAAVLFLAFHPVSGLETVFLDVGQGDGIFLRTRQADILVDGGSTQVKNLGKSRLTPFLKSRGVSKLDFVFISHGDQDHISGIRYLLEEGEIEVDHLVFSCLSAEDESCQELAALCTVRGGRVEYMKKGDVLECGKLSLTAVYPREEQIAEDKNEQSLVLLARYGDFSMLLTGDVGSGGEARMLSDGEEAGGSKALLPGHLTVLKAGHHGSETSTGEKFLERLHPDITVLSYGEHNSYGHPAAKTVERLKKTGTRIWRTAVSGAVTVRTDGTEVSVEGFIKNAK